MPNIHIYGLEREKAKVVENEIFKIVESDGNPDLGKIVITIHEKTTVTNREGDNQPYILISGDYFEDLKNIAQELIVLEIDIEIQKIDAFYPKEAS